MKDALGNKLWLGDKVVHVRNSSGSVYFAEGVVSKIDGGKCWTGMNHDGRAGKGSNRIIKLFNQSGE